jgi:hypothetical protein
MTNTERTDVLDTVRDAVLEVDLPGSIAISQRAVLARFVVREVARRLPISDPMSVFPLPPTAS